MSAKLRKRTAATERGQAASYGAHAQHLSSGAPIAGAPARCAGPRRAVEVWVDGPEAAEAETASSVIGTLGRPLPGRRLFSGTAITVPAANSWFAGAARP